MGIVESEFFFGLIFGDISTYAKPRNILKTYSLILLKISEWNDDTILPTTLNWTILKGNPSFPGRPWCSDICHFAYTFLSGFVRESENFRRAWFAQQRRSNVKYPSPRSAQESEESISHFELSHHHYHTSRKKATRHPHHFWVRS